MLTEGPSRRREHTVSYETLNEEGIRLWAMLNEPRFPVGVLTNLPITQNSTALRNESLRTPNISAASSKPAAPLLFLPDKLSAEMEARLDWFKLQMSKRPRSPDAKTIADALFHVRRLLLRAGVRTLESIRYLTIADVLNALEKEVSRNTLNKAVSAIKAFTESHADPLCFGDSGPMLAFDPLAQLKRYPTNNDRRLIRAALTPDQWQKLLTSTLASRVVKFGVEPRQRAAAYTCAISTGMRKGEVRELTGADARLNDSDPYFILRTGSTKNKRHHIARPSPDAIEFLRGHCEGKAPTEKLFKFPKYECQDVIMLREDIEAAGLNPYVMLGNGGHDEQIDWHAFRVSFVTWLLERGATVQEVMHAVGHRSEHMVLHYARLLEQRRKQTPQRLAGLFTIPR
jgi:integrase